MAPESETVSKRRALTGVRAIFERYWLAAEKENYRGFDYRIMLDLELVDASIGPAHAAGPDQEFPSPTVLATATFALHVTPHYCNLNGVMHGGAAAVIFDMATTCALGPIARPGHWDFMGGVTRSLNISYLKAVPQFAKVRIYSCVYQAGKTMAYLKGWMTSEDGKIVYVVCEHHKVGVPSQPQHMETKIPWDEQFAGGKASEAFADEEWAEMEKKREAKQRERKEREREVDLEWERVLRSKM